MTKWLKKKSTPETQKAPRDLKTIEQDFANTSALVGDTHFKIELERGRLQKLTMRLAEIKDEHARAKEIETKRNPPTTVPQTTQTTTEATT